MRIAVLTFILLFSIGCAEPSKHTQLFQIKPPQIFAPRINRFCDPNYEPPKGQLFEPPDGDCIPVQDCNKMVIGVIRDRCPALI